MIDCLYGVLTEGKYLMCGKYRVLSAAFFLHPHCRAFSPKVFRSLSTFLVHGHAGGRVRDSRASCRLFRKPRASDVGSFTREVWNFVTIISPSSLLFPCPKRFLSGLFFGVNPYVANLDWEEPLSCCSRRGTARHGELFSLLLWSPHIR